MKGKFGHFKVDANYTQPQWTYEEDSDVEPESDQNSLVYEDIEASSDDEIFLEKNLSKRQMMMKLRKMLQQKSKKKNINHDAGAKDCIAKDNGWYGDPGEEDELQSLDGSDLQGDSHAPNYPYFKTGTKMKTFELVVGMKFQSGMVFREALRDYCVRHGYDLHFKRNENARITAKCKHEGCNWRIHVSPVQGGSIFQVKTL
ncbi:hypothetical protein Sango_2831400 [Sesamum angolense]|uniref:Transposase MuDR plant domain-containing protein n=1 Tax=Sesamum angolense TaxID=2727404 RepID=A0AAE1T736_9LAMI|nr:hypothetical protein Sango_2831400 [Sesamum angolense]